MKNFRFLLQEVVSGFIYMDYVLKRDCINFWILDYYVPEMKYIYQSLLFSHFF